MSKIDDRIKQLEAKCKHWHDLAQQRGQENAELRRQLERVNDIGIALAGNGGIADKYQRQRDHIAASLDRAYVEADAELARQYEYLDQAKTNIPPDQIDNSWVKNILWIAEFMRLNHDKTVGEIEPILSLRPGDNYETAQHPDTTLTNIVMMNQRIVTLWAMSTLISVGYVMGKDYHTLAKGIIDELETSHETDPVLIRVNPILIHQLYDTIENIRQDTMNVYFRGDLSGLPKRMETCITHLQQRQAEINSKKSRKAFSFTSRLDEKSLFNADQTYATIQRWATMRD